MPSPTEKNSIMNVEKLENIIPENVLRDVPKVVADFNINSELRLSHFLAQVAHESGFFRYKEENLSYSKDALLRVFGKYFNEELASQYHRKPKSIASRVYANRMGNGDENSQEGWKYRGRGYIQLTGKDNYISFNNFVNNFIEVDIVSNPDLVCDKYPLLSAGWFWDKNKLNSIADQGDTNDIIKKVTRRVNGGYHGLEDRVNYFKKFYKALT